MIPHDWSDEQMRAFLDEQLSPEMMSRLEEDLRADGALRGQLARLARERDHGAHTLGDVWRRGRLSCPSRAELDAYCRRQLSDDEARYLDFHVRTIGCRYCQANLDDLEQQAAPADRSSRRRRLFESSAGYLKGSGLSREE